MFLVEICSEEFQSRCFSTAAFHFQPQHFPTVGWQDVTKTAGSLRPSKAFCMENLVLWPEGAAPGGMDIRQVSPTIACREAPGLP